MEARMRAMGTVLLTGAAAIILWKIMAGVFFGLLGLALKVGLVLLVVYFLLRIFNGNKKKDE
jgi:predicted membrane protein